MKMRVRFFFSNYIGVTYVCFMNDVYFIGVVKKGAWPNHDNLVARK